MNARLMLPADQSSAAPITAVQARATALTTEMSPTSGGLAAIARAQTTAMQMAAARQPRTPRDAVAMLVIDRTHGSIEDRGARDLPALLDPGDLVVLNDAATLPASLPAMSAYGAIELRLTGPPANDRAEVVLFGEGDFRIDTEARPAPPLLSIGEQLQIGTLTARVCAISKVSPRLVTLAIDSQALWRVLYEIGAPVQYSYMTERVRLDSYQTLWAGRPWAVEPASAGRPLSWALIERLRARGIDVATVTHAAGLSSTGDPALDAVLPLPERFEVPEATARKVNAAIAAGHRVVAVGTTVVRALESAALEGRCTARQGITSLRIGDAHRPQLCSALITGMHHPGEPHFELATTFAPRPLLHRAIRHATERGYLSHELGDLTLIL